MSARQQHDQINLLNKNLQNQYARVLLKRAGVDPDPSMLYLYQLIVWALENGEVRLENPGGPWATSRLLDRARILMFWGSPLEAMRLLEIDPKQLAQQKTPSDAAVYLIYNLESSLLEYELPDPNRY